VAATLVRSAAEEEHAIRATPREAGS